MINIRWVSYIHTCVYIHNICSSTYIYIEREREKYITTCVCVYIYIYIHHRGVQSEGGAVDAGGVIE